MFRITNGKGFHITFANGYTVSVQFGPANYCDHYDRSIGHDESKCGAEGSTSAECAVWPRGGDLVETVEGTDLSYGVTNRSTPEQVLALLNWAAAQDVAKVETTEFEIGEPEREE